MWKGVEPYATPPGQSGQAKYGHSKWFIKKTMNHVRTGAIPGLFLLPESPMRKPMTTLLTSETQRQIVCAGDHSSSPATARMEGVTPTVGTHRFSAPTGTAAVPQGGHHFFSGAESVVLRLFEEGQAAEFGVGEMYAAEGLRQGAEGRVPNEPR